MRRMTIHLRTYMRDRSKFDMRLCYQLEMLLAEYEGSATPLGSGQGQGPKRAAQPRIATIEHADLAAGVVSLQLVENRPEVGPARRQASSSNRYESHRLYMQSTATARKTCNQSWQALPSTFDHHDPADA